MSYYLGPGDVPDWPQEPGQIGNTVELKVQRQGYVQKRQVPSQNILKLPTELFLEIAQRVYPRDLISLIRTNRQFRRLLLHRSSADIWRRVISNVPRLPRCLSGMSEPRYVALLFSKSCSFCGVPVPTPTRPDAYIRLRLCPSCRKSNKLEQVVPPGRTEHRFVAKTQFLTRFPEPKKTHKSQIYCVREEAQEVARIRTRFQAQGDKEGLAKWERTRIEGLAARHKETEELLRYIHSDAYRWWKLR